MNLKEKKWHAIFDQQLITFQGHMKRRIRKDGNSLPTCCNLASNTAGDDGVGGSESSEDSKTMAEEDQDMEI